MNVKYFLNHRALNYTDSVGSHLRVCSTSLFRREISPFFAKTMRGEEGVFGEYADESRIVCSSRREAHFVATKSSRLRNGEIAAEYGDVEQALRTCLTSLERCG